MKITTKDLGDRQVMLTIEVDEKRVDKELRGVARRIAREYNVPGFRRGRAPYHIVLQRFGREMLLNEVLEDLGKEVISEAMKDVDLEPYNTGELEDIQLDPLVFKLRLPLLPTVDLGDYRELRVELPDVSVEEEKIDAELERLRENNIILGPADDRPAQVGDMVTLDVSADVGGESLVRNEGYRMVLSAGEIEIETGFTEQIVGMETGQEKQFMLTLSASWGEDKAGQEAAFTVTLRKVQERILPGLDDDLARTVSDFDTLQELRQNLRQQLEEQAQRKADQEYSEQVLDALVSGATIEYPPDMVEKRVDDMLNNYEEYLKTQKIALDDYLKLRGQNKDEFRESILPQAKTDIRRSLALGELVTQESLDVKEEEIDQSIALLSTSWGERADDMRDKLSAPDSMRSIANNLLSDKAVQRLVAIAKGEAPPLEQAGEESQAEDTITESAESIAEETPAEPTESIAEETPDENITTSSETT